MSTNYRIYGNGGGGGPIDYATVLQDSPSTTFAYATIPPGDWTFGVRAYDTVSGLEEANTDATVRVIIGADYQDRTAIPNSPTAVTVTSAAGGKAKLDWLYVAEGQSGSPSSFLAWLWPAAVDWTLPPTATLPVVPSPGEAFHRYYLTLTGLSDGVTYTVGLRASATAGNDGNTRTFSIVGSAAGPNAVVGLSGSSSYPIH